jgi:ATP-dependent Clp protease ATP-binding subunit ClpA
MPARLTTASRACVRAGEAEARRRGGSQIGTDHLLLGLLLDPVGEAADALGVDLEAARAAEDALDRDALAAVGVSVPEGLEVAVRARTRRVTFSAGARGVLARALRKAAASRSRQVTTGHLLLALLECPSPDPAGVLLERLAVDPSAVRARLLGAA